MAKMGRPARLPDEHEQLRLAGERLRWVREAMGRTQEEMAALVGVHQTAWSYYERGKRFPDEFGAVRLAAKLRVSLAYLRGGPLDSGIDPGLAIRLAAAHPELVAPIDKASRKGKRLS